MKNKIVITEKTIIIFLIALATISMYIMMLTTINSILPDEFKNLPEGEDIIDISQYENVNKEWIPSGVPNRRAKGSKTKYLYDNDPNAIFFANQPQHDNAAGTVYYHKKDDILPKSYEETALIILTISGKTDIKIEGELAIEFKEFIKDCLVKYKNTININKLFDKAKIKIYHKDYPAYHNFATIGISLNSLIMSRRIDNDYIYYKLLDSLSKQIKILIEK